LEVCKRRKTRKAPPPPPAELPDELVTEILLRLPVKSLLRFKSVSKGWRATISDPFFIGSHLRQSASRWRQSPSLLVTPHALAYVIEGEAWPTTFCTEICFFEWQWQRQPPKEEEENPEARFIMHCGEFLGEFNTVCYFAHCDGLVLAPTDGTVYLFNPATRDTMTLPDSNRNKMHHYEACRPVGLGLDPLTGRHKVVRAFYRSRDPLTGIYDMGMEVFTVGDACASTSWRETTADPPYPVAEFVTAVFANGALFWAIDKHGLEPNPHGLLRLRLDDESFSVTRLPHLLDDPDALDGSFILDEMHGELCLTAFSSSSKPSELMQPLKMWTLVEQDASSSTSTSRWEHRYSLAIPGMVRPIALLPGGAMMVRASQHLCRYDLQTHQLETVCELDRLRYNGTIQSARREIFYFNVVPYTESLVRITATC
jgi:F-box interacting protein